MDCCQIEALVDEDFIAFILAYKFLWGLDVRGLTLLEEMDLQPLLGKLHIWVLLLRFNALKDSAVSFFVYLKVVAHSAFLSVWVSHWLWGLQIESCAVLQMSLTICLSAYIGFTVVTMEPLCWIRFQQQSHNVQIVTPDIAGFPNSDLCSWMSKW